MYTSVGAVCVVCRVRWHPDHLITISDVILFVASDRIFAVNKIISWYDKPTMYITTGWQFSTETYFTVDNLNQISSVESHAWVGY